MDDAEIILEERKLLLARMNHCDTLTLVIRTVALTAAVAVLTGAIAATGGVTPFKKPLGLPGHLQFLLPILVLYPFLAMEARVRSKYEICKARWNYLNGTPHQPPQWERAYDWISAPISGVHYIHGEQLKYYAPLALICGALWIAFAYTRLGTP